MHQGQRMREYFAIPSSQYISHGCWWDNADRILKGSNQGRPHTKETCGAIAESLGHRYFGVQDGNECYTGNEDYTR